MLSWYVWYNLILSDTTWPYLIQLDAVWYNFTLCNTTSHCLIQLDLIQLGLIQLDAVWYNLTLPNTTWRCLIQLHAVWCNLMPSDTTWCCLIQLDAETPRYCCCCCCYIALNTKTWCVLILWRPWYLLMRLLPPLHQGYGESSSDEFPSFLERDTNFSISATYTRRRPVDIVRKMFIYKNCHILSSF